MRRRTEVRTGLQELGRRRGVHSENDAIRLDLPEIMDRAAHMHPSAMGLEIRDDGRDQSVHSPAKRGHCRSGRRLGAHRRDPTSQRSMLDHSGEEPRRSGLDIQRLRVSGVDSCHDRGDEAIHHSLTHAVPHELRHADPRCATGGGLCPPAQRHAQVFGGSGGSSGPQRGPDIAGVRVPGDAEDSRRGYGSCQVRQLQPRRRRGRRHDRGLEPQLAQQCGDRGGSIGECFGAGVEVDSGQPMGGQSPSHTVTALEDLDVESCPGQITRRHEPGDPGTDDGNPARSRRALRPGLPWHRHQDPESSPCGYPMLWMSSTTRVRTSGSVSGGTPCPRFST